jgi:uncharacterized protein (TIGR03546 family)
MNEKNIIRRFYDKFISLKGEPEHIAFGLAIGIFIGITPTIPFHTVLSIALAFILRQNCTASFLGATAVANPLSIPFLYVTEYHFGKYLLGSNMQEVVFTDYHMWDILNVGWSVAYPLLVGGFALALLLAIPAYLIAYMVVITIRKKVIHVDSEKST